MPEARHTGSWFDSVRKDETYSTGFSLISDPLGPHWIGGEICFDFFLAPDVAFAFAPPRHTHTHMTDSTAEDRQRTACRATGSRWTSVCYQQYSACSTDSFWSGRRVILTHVRCQITLDDDKEQARYACPYSGTYKKDIMSLET